MATEVQVVRNVLCGPSELMTAAMPTTKFVLEIGEKMVLFILLDTNGIKLE